MHAVDGRPSTPNMSSKVLEVHLASSGNAAAAVTFVMSLLIACGRNQVERRHGARSAGDKDVLRHDAPVVCKEHLGGGPCLRRRGAEALELGPCGLNAKAWALGRLGRSEPSRGDGGECVACGNLEKLVVRDGSEDEGQRVGEGALALFAAR
eukprot:scaffold232295_cov30-Tisochrysis_lutea.AAC.4